MRATYRLQLGPDLTFADARELVPYLRDLGISHLYLSPSPAAREAGMGIVLDVVPNHMANADENPFWADESKRAKFFDLDPETGRWRRFFDIDDLAGVRVEDPEVFETTHGKVLELVADGLVDGLRIDHPDGLADPAGYLRRLRERGVPHVWVEKIVDPGEHLRDWPVDGTTGYEFLNDVAALFVDPAGEEILTALHTEMTGDARPFGEVASEAKREQASTVFQPEVERLRRLHDAPGLVEALSSLPVYRTYVEPWSGRVEDADREVLDEAGIDEPLRSVLLLSDDTVPGEFVTRFQQTSPPIMAKGVEDTAFYRHVRLLALNDVGGDPSRFGIDVGRFHAANRERHERFPTAMLTSQTHDTKRSGDVRARIGALAGMAGEWAAAVRRWRSIAEPLRVDGAPDGQELLLILQTLVGAWPISAGRMQAYLEKALREAKRNTNWVDQNHAYEDGVRSFIATLLDHQPFLDDFVPFAERVAEAGERAALAQLLLKLTVPGFPDVYQGDELWSLSLVDPDNRRPVDWEQRRLALAELRAGAAATRETAKLDLITRTLDLRARRPESFGRSGAYQPIEAGDRACVFLRGSDVLVGVETLAGGRDGRLFAGTRIEGAWTDVLTGAPRELHRDTALDELLGPSGLCLLERRG